MLELIIKNTSGYVLIFSLIYIIRILYLYIKNWAILFKNNPELNDIQTLFKISKKELLFVGLVLSYILTYFIF